MFAIKFLTIDSKILLIRVTIFRNCNFVCFEIEFYCKLSAPEHVYIHIEINVLIRMFAFVPF